MRIVWVTVEDYRERRPEAVDLESSPTTVYLNKNIKRASKEDSMSGERIEFWQCDRATLSRAEYEEYEQMAQVFNMPEFEAMRNEAAEQQLTLAEIAVNTEYSVCLQELSM